TSPLNADFFQLLKYYIFVSDYNQWPSSAKSRSMAMSSEVIVAIVGVLVNVPTFILVFWHCFRRRTPSNSARNSAIVEEAVPLQSPSLHPRRLTFDRQYAVAFPCTLPLINVSTPRF
ncbi:hypothetical protein LB506_004052, partial [Fusarium annulatum]